MMIKDKVFDELVDVCDSKCFKRYCYWARPDPGIFIQGVGYKTRDSVISNKKANKKKKNLKTKYLCGTREIRGCPIDYDKESTLETLQEL